MRINKRFKIISLLIFLLYIIVFIITGCNNNSFSNLLSVHMIDVGQGDSILIITPENKTILIDGGEAHMATRVKAYLKRNGIKKIDILIGTHPHADHIGGLSEVIDNFQINEIIMPNKIHTSATFENLMDSISNKNLKINSSIKDTIINFEEDLTLHFLGPVQDYGDNLNQWSVVLKLVYKNKSFLFTGDIEYESEINLINNYDKDILKSNVLKVAHHGSNTSSSERFMEDVKPEIALIPTGIDNPYGHPHKEVLERLDESGVLIYRTDLQGNIVLISDGIEIWSNQPPSNKKDSFQKLH